MHAQFEYITNLQYEVKRLKKLVEESGVPCRIGG